MKHNWQEKVIFAYIDEPPFAQTNEIGNPSGCDVTTVQAVLKALDVKEIEMRLVTFPDLLQGVANHKWTLNTPLFDTEERSKTVRFSRPVWALSDGLMIRKETELSGYDAIAANEQIRLGVISGQVQHQTARNAGISDEQITIFETQEDVVYALLNEEVDAYAATAMGHRAFIQQQNHQNLTVVDVHDSDTPALGAFSFALSNIEFANAFDTALSTYVKSSDYLNLMLSYGFSEDNIEFVRSKHP